MLNYTYGVSLQLEDYKTASDVGFQNIKSFKFDKTL